MDIITYKVTSEIEEQWNDKLTV